MLGEQLNSDESRTLLSTIDKMREILHEEKISLPEIVVVGDQSVGKSSVLEAISGIQLPRAQNICTRCPLELRMKTTRSKEYALIRESGKNTKEKRINDLTKIAEEVTRLTSKIAGDGVNISADPIYLTVYRREIPYDLTLIDLPGITRNPLPGQAADIHQQTLTLINKYIEPPTAIVLHVIPASVDFSTSESMKLAKVFDPQCERQLIAASKIDKYDKGIADKLQGRGLGSMDLQLGCVAVLNRNQDEIDQNISFDEMKEREKRFFLAHREAFQHLPEEYKGSGQLVRRLATIQQERIRSTFPEIIKKLRKHMADKKAQLKKIPASLDTESECWASFQSMINVFRESIGNNVKGEYDQVASTAATTSDDEEDGFSSDIDFETLFSESDGERVVDSDNSEDHIAYRIYHLQQQFQDACRRSYANFFSAQYHQIVLREIEHASGVSLPNFPSYQIVVGLFRKELQKIPPCCHELLENMHQYMSECLLRLFDQAFTSDHPRLRERLKELIVRELDGVKNKLSERIEEVIETERRVFTLNHYYMDTVNKLKEKSKARDAERQTPAVDLSSVSNEAQAARDIQIALHAYAKVVEKRMTDNVSQMCYYQFITQCALKIDQTLSMAIPSSQLVQYMREPCAQTNLRNNLINSIRAYEEALSLGLAHM